MTVKKCNSFFPTSFVQNFLSVLEICSLSSLVNGHCSDSIPLNECNDDTSVPSGGRGVPWYIYSEGEVRRPCFGLKLAIWGVVFG